MIIPINETYRAEVNRIIAEGWAGPMIVTRGIAYDTSNSDGFIAVEDGKLAGYALYKVGENDCELQVFESLLENQGIGWALIQAVMAVARAHGCRRLWLITTNDNTHAIRYYQKRGFELKAAHIGAIEESRRLKPQLPLTGFDGLPIKHEIEFEYIL